MVELTVVPNNTYFFVTNGELEYNVPFEKVWLREPEMDWYLAIGGGQNVLQSEVICEVIDGKKIYTAKIKFYVIDYYDWDKNNNFYKYLYNLHLYGLAKNYLSYGVYETQIQWEKSGRYPDYGKIYYGYEDITF